MSAGVEGERSPIRKRVSETWETVAVTALPAGWRNVYADRDGIEHASPCPAILLQENRARVTSFDEPGEPGGPPFRRRTFTDPHEPPYETRAVFADYDDAHLCPADEAVNYQRTDGPSCGPHDATTTSQEEVAP